MKSSTKHDLSHICFEGKAARRHHAYRGGASATAFVPAVSISEAGLDDFEFLSWVLGRAGLDAAAYRPQPLHRRLPACLRALEVRSIDAARERLEREPRLVAKAISSLLIGVTEFFRDPEVFDSLRTQVLPTLAGGDKRLRIWSAACSTGTELYSMAVVLSEAGLLERSDLLGTDCRSDAVELAKQGLFDATTLKPVQGPMRDKYFERTGPHWRPVESIRRRLHWKVADLLTGVEQGPWDIILWRNAAIYLNACPAETIWRRLASVLAPRGVLIAGKAERPPSDLGLTQFARHIYRIAENPATGPAGGKQPSLPPQSIDKKLALESLP
jgi:chemotaxis methyl-accepting protein methylase